MWGSLRLLGCCFVSTVLCKYSLSVRGGPGSLLQQPLPDPGLQSGVTCHAWTVACGRFSFHVVAVGLGLEARRDIKSL